MNCINYYILMQIKVVVYIMIFLLKQKILLNRNCIKVAKSILIIWGNFGSKYF
jgi:hypothetical protein